MLLIYANKTYRHSHNHFPKQSRMIERDDYRLAFATGRKTFTLNLELAMRENLELPRKFTVVATSDQAHDFNMIRPFFNIRNAFQFFITKHCGTLSMNNHLHFSALCSFCAPKRIPTTAAFEIG